MNDTIRLIMCWNVRGLNNPAKRVAVFELAVAHKVAILFMQETKIDAWSPSLVREIGGSSLTDYIVLPEIGSSRGAAIFWNNDLASIDSHAVGIFAITAKKLGFPARWRDWISLLLLSASSSFLLNNASDRAITHRRGLQQGDPLSLLVFIIAIDPLHRLLLRAMELDLIEPLPGRDICLRLRLYADDAVIFAKPIKEEIDTLLTMLHDFGAASSLNISPTKSTTSAIRCKEIDLPLVLHHFCEQIVAFPLRYLGLSVMLSRIRLVHVHFIVDRIRARVVGWKGKLLSIADTRVLVRSVLTVLPTFAMAVLWVAKKFFSEVDKARRRFLWAQDNEVTGDKCKISWPMV
ncbi:hypothetical protein D1007_40689 [Hordeum vulgare]|nr:hypothetical protein D1007_40689 [Hordeum vulgare]